jgi:hypothetical protein
MHVSDCQPAAARWLTPPPRRPEAAPGAAARRRAPQGPAQPPPAAPAGGNDQRRQRRCCQSVAAAKWLPGVAAHYAADLTLQPLRNPAPITPSPAQPSPAQPSPAHRLHSDVWAGSRLRQQLALALCTGGAGLHAHWHLQAGPRQGRQGGAALLVALVVRHCGRSRQSRWRPAGRCS